MEQMNLNIKQVVKSEMVYLFLSEDIDEEAEEQMQAENVFRNLQGINEDAVGWISIIDTDIDYPVLQAEDNDYYLFHNIENVASSRGSIFMDCQNAEDDLHIILYGHNMVDGSMLGNMELYEDEEYYKAHPIVEFNMYGKHTCWEIFSVAITDNKPYRLRFIDSADYFGYIDEMKQNSIYDIEVDITQNDCVLTLSTCSSRSSNERYVLHAKLIDNEGE